MTTAIQEILDELYKLDPTLKEHESELQKLIAGLIKHRPDVTPDPQFLRELRGLLLQRADEFAAPRPSFFSTFTMPKFSYALTGAILGVLVAGPTAYYLSRNGSSLPPTGGDGQALFSYEVTPTEERAFGDLSAAQPMQAGGRGGGVANEMAATRPQSGGGGGDMTMDSKIGLYPPVTYEYKYEFAGSGSFPPLSEQTVNVLKRQIGKSSVSLSAIAANFRTPFLNLDSFNGAQVDNVTFTQRGDRGYMVNVNLRDSSMNINQNWEAWPHPENACQDEACWQRYRVGINDILPDDQVISIANAFAQAHGIDLSRYGEPEVNAQWRTEYERATDKSQVWIPDVQTVIYPLLVEGKPVHDESGNKSGISVNVNIRQKAVSDVWGIADQTFLSSEYDAVTDEAKVREYISALDAQPVMPLTMEDGTPIERKTVTVYLGTPQMAYAKYFLYNDPSKPAEELVVPSLIFPVEKTDSSDGFIFWRQSIVVPLATELVDQRLNQQNAGGGVMYR